MEGREYLHVKSELARTGISSVFITAVAPPLLRVRIERVERKGEYSQDTHTHRQCNADLLLALHLQAPDNFPRQKREHEFSRGGVT